MYAYAKTKHCTVKNTGPNKASELTYQEQHYKVSEEESLKFGSECESVLTSPLFNSI